MKYNHFRQLLLIINVVIVGSESGFLSFVNSLGDHERICTGLLSMRIYALYDRSKRIMWFMIICATTLSGISCVSPVLDSVRWVLIEGFQWYTFWDNDALHTLSIRCYNAATTNVYVHLAGSFSNQLK